MLKQYFTAIDDQGKIHSPCIEERGGSYFLTFHKETLAGVRKLRVLPMLAKAGTEGFFITPRNIEMSGDLLVKFVPREDTCYSYNLPIMSCYGTGSILWRPCLISRKMILFMTISASRSCP